MLGYLPDECFDFLSIYFIEGGSDAYIEEWRRESVTLDGVADLVAEARSEAEAIESAFSDEQLLQLIRNHGASDKPA